MFLCGIAICCIFIFNEYLHVIAPFEAFIVSKVFKTYLRMLKPCLLYMECDGRLLLKVFFIFYFLLAPLPLVDLKL